ncbi:hypothetical protein IOC44_08845 [Vibrio vulnificus]|uniref:hypothetical protein n=1 Tax=Vibrio vulnificus TaxID=672 RepID=UPI001E5301D5|nr:hypothetical protein [Vibrio vulnificus]MCD1409661.1 hypothetical protein [Vibrio vulnificus]MCD1418723.1 hypothetical protein [Vibrio vulnificus]MCD1422737.1 hypothetical protein [Vibrio vulnificus]MCD1437890.1 hypothetical protein [Vibrio vulnificus]MCD1442748.1 hypothetical protein [Vibrio vulnificus]
MTQNQLSGAAANDWGRQIARIIAEKLGTSISSKMSNECIYKDSRVVIKSAKVDTDSVGVTYKMLERLDFVIGAFQQESGEFELFQLPVSIFERHMRATASKGAAKGKVGIVRQTVFEDQGKNLGSVTV